METETLTSPVTVSLDKSEDLSCQFDDVSATETVAVKVQKPSKKNEKKEKAPKVEMERINGLIPKELSTKLRNIVLWHPNVTLTDLIKEGAEFVVGKYGDLPLKDGKLKVGRRKKVEDTTQEEASETTPAQSEAKIS